MYGAFSFPMTAERRRNKERLEASLAGICELELLKQSQECLVLSALSIRDSVPGRPAWGNLQPTRPSPDTANCALEDLSYRRQPNSLQCSPWGLMASLEQQVGELRVNTADNAVEPLTDMVDNRPRSGFYELSEHLSPMGLSDSSGFGEPSPSTARAIRMVYANDRPKSAGEFFGANRDRQPESGTRPTIPRSFSAPYPTLEGIAEGASEGEGEDEAWPWDTSKGPGGVVELGGDTVEGEPTEEDYRQAQRVETYILGLIQRRALPLRPCKPRTSLGLHEARTAITVARQNSVCRKEPDPRPATDSIPDHHSHSNPHHATAAVSPSSYERPPPSWACRSLDQEPFAVMALVPEDPPHHHHQHPHPHYPQSRRTPWPTPALPPWTTPAVKLHPRNLAAVNLTHPSNSTMATRPCPHRAWLPRQTSSWSMPSISLPNHSGPPPPEPLHTPTRGPNPAGAPIIQREAPNSSRPHSSCSRPSLEPLPRSVASVKRGKGRRRERKKETGRERGTGTGSERWSGREAPRSQEDGPAGPSQRTVSMGRGGSLNASTTRWRETGEGQGAAAGASPRGRGPSRAAPATAAGAPPWISARTKPSSLHSQPQCPQPTMAPGASANPGPHLTPMSTPCPIIIPTTPIWSTWTGIVHTCVGPRRATRTRGRVSLSRV
ncbi:dapper homolog 3-like [Oncorhynchus tshawytscha]|uniref:dapper homolog 3-like n=1 Tax=Oncorhynchus tshawytscha TaxID=74940 RepID=UPI001C3E3327|nr:dapper homolog 3-like [Oncorhynchus tshawytscha]